MKRGWWGRLKVWVSNQYTLHGIVVDLEQQLAETQKALAEQQAIADDLRHHLGLARQDADRADALRADALSRVAERTQTLGAFHGRIEAIHKLITRMPPEVAAEVRRHTRPEEHDQ